MLQTNGTLYETDDIEFERPETLQNLLNKILESVPNQLPDTLGPDTFNREMDEMIEVSPEAQELQGSAMTLVAEKNDDQSCASLRKGADICGEKQIPIAQAAFLALPVMMIDDSKPIDKVIETTKEALGIYR